jgi:hypothetical protein
MLSLAMLSVIMLNVHYKPFMLLCHYAECSGAMECKSTLSMSSYFVLCARLNKVF